MTVQDIPPYLARAYVPEILPIGQGLVAQPQPHCLAFPF